MAVINFPDPAANNPNTGNTYGDAWYNPGNGVTYAFIDDTWRTVEVSTPLNDLYVLAAGDTMTGALTLPPGDPTDDRHAANKQYVDTEITDAITTNEGGETGRLDPRYLIKNDSNALNQTVESTGTTTFNGLVTTKGGFELLGTVSAGNVEDGIGKSGNSLVFKHNDVSRMEIRSDRTEVSTPNTATTRGFTVAASNTQTTPTITTYESFLASSPSKVNSFTGYVANASNTVYSALNIGFDVVAELGNNNCDAAYGFRSNIAKINGKNNFNFFANGDAPNYFKGLTEHENGVRLTGGLPSTVKSGLFFYDNYIGVALDEKNFARFGYTFNSERYGLYAAMQHIYKSGVDTIFGCFPDVQSADLTNVTDVYSYRAALNQQSEVTGTANNWYGYYAQEAAASSYATNAYAFYSNISSANATNAFNFYAAGDAPNYFKGNSLFNASIDSPGFGNNSTGTCINTSTNRFFVSTAGQAAMELNRNDAGVILAFRMNGGMTSSGDVSGSISNVTETSSVFSCGLSTKDNGFTSTSDYRLKENIADITDATAQVKQLKPRTYNWINRTETVQGFVAHELQEVNDFYATGTKDATEAIGTLADYDGTVLQTEVTEPAAEELEYTEETTDEYGVSTQSIRTRTWTATGTRPVYQGVDQTKLIPLLTKALQEALTEIDTLKGRLDILEGN